MMETERLIAEMRAAIPALRMAARSDVTIQRSDYAMVLWFLVSAADVLDATTADSHRLAVLTAMCEGAIKDAKEQCGGDGRGCEMMRSYYDTDERRWSKCDRCPMDALLPILHALSYQSSMNPRPSPAPYRK